MRMRTENLTKFYPGRTDRKNPFCAVENASLTLHEGESIGLFGDSGSGKSTLGQMLTGLLKPTSGSIFFEEEPIRYPFRGSVRRQIQILFQHPEVSFNPALPILTSLKEPSQLYDIAYSDKILLDGIQRFGLHEEHLYRKPSELSGGELQRAALFRLLTLQPKVIVLDEPTSMLDVITQAQMIQLLRAYQEHSGVSYVFITHNRTLCQQFCHRIYDMNAGTLTEEK